MPEIAQIPPQSGSVDGRRILLISPRGFCAGVVRAIDVVRLRLNCMVRRSTSAKKSSITDMWWTSCAKPARSFVEELGGPAAPV